MDPRQQESDPYPRGPWCLASALPDRAAELQKELAWLGHVASHSWSFDKYLTLY
jgi:hypothetical protein